MAWKIFDKLYDRLCDIVVHHLDREIPGNYSPMFYNFEGMCREIRPGDILLIEGRTKLDEIIRVITQSSWAHSVLYIGRIYDIPDIMIRTLAEQRLDIQPDTHLVIESRVGQGTVINPLPLYQGEHIRICRPRGITPEDTKKVIQYALSQLGKTYDIKHILDLARLLLPWRILPKKWHSDLFENTASDTMKTICSTMIAEAFDSVRFPILPIIKKTNNQQLVFYKRNSKLFIPRDFDYSPYFDIIKYHFYDTPPYYHDLPWHAQNPLDYSSEKNNPSNN